MTPIIISTNTVVLENDTLSMFWPNVFNDLNKVSKFKPQRGETKEGKKVHNTALKLYNDLLGTYFDEYYTLSDAKRSKINPHMLLLISYLMKITIMNSIKKNQVMKKN